MDWNYFAFNAQQTFYGTFDEELEIWREPVNDDGVVLYKTDRGLLVPEYVNREDRDVIPFFPTIDDIIQRVKQKNIWIIYTTDIWDIWFRGLSQRLERTDREEFLDVLWENHADHLKWEWVKIITVGR